MRARRLFFWLAAVLASVGLSFSLQGQSFFRRGDVQVDGELELTDPVRLLGFLFLGKPNALACHDAGDANDDGSLDLTDAVHTLNYLFAGDAPLAAPFSECGLDPTPDSLSCASFVACAQLVITNDEVVVADDESITIEGIHADRVFLSETAAAAGLQPGEILVSAAGRGLLRRVESLESIGDDLIEVETSQATLEDVFEKATVTAEHSLPYEAIESFEALVDGVTFAPEEDGGDGAGAEGGGAQLRRTRVLLDGVTLPGDDSGTTITASYLIAPTLRVELDIEDCPSQGRPCLRHLLFETVLEIEGQTTVELNGYGNTLNARLHVARLHAEPFIEAVGVVPVVFAPVLDLYLTFDGTLESGFRWQTRLTLQPWARVQYDRESGWSARGFAGIELGVDSGPQHELSVRAASVDAEAALRAEASLLVYGVPAAVLAFDAPYSKLHTDCQLPPEPPQCEFELFGGARSAAAIQLNVLGNTLASYENAALFDTALPLEHGTQHYEQVLEEVWVERYNGAANDLDTPRAIGLDSSRNVYVTGTSGITTDPPYQPQDYVTLQYTSLGEPLRSFTYNAPGPGGDFYSIDEPRALVVDEGSGLAARIHVTGASDGDGTGRDYATVVYGADGSEHWARRYNNAAANGWDVATAVNLDSIGNVYVTGFSRGSETGWDYATIRYNADGTERWVRRYGESGNGTDRANALVVGPPVSGLCFVTGESRGTDTRTDYATVCYSSADGTERWVRRYDGPSHFEDNAVAIAVDGARQKVYVTGSSFSVDTGSDYATVCYDFNGNQLWAKRYNGTGNRDDSATAIAVSPNGDVCVTGNSRGRGWDYATVCYDPNGNQFWVRRYEGAGDDQARALAIDSGGNIVVTGSTTIEEAGYTHTDYATLSYDPIGVERWVAIYDGTGHGSDAAAALVIDGADNVYVTGESFGDAGGMDYATVKYAVRAGDPAEQTHTQCQALAATTAEIFRAAEAAAEASRAVTSLVTATGEVTSAAQAYKEAESAVQQHATAVDIKASRAHGIADEALRAATAARDTSNIAALNVPPSGAEGIAAAALQEAAQTAETITAVEAAAQALRAAQAATGIASRPGAVSEAESALAAAQQAATTAETAVQASTAAETAAQQAAQDAECP